MADITYSSNVPDFYDNNRTVHASITMRTRYTVWGPSFSTVHPKISPVVFQYSDYAALAECMSSTAVNYTKLSVNTKIIVR